MVCANRERINVPISGRLRRPAAALGLAVTVLWTCSAPAQTIRCGDDDTSPLSCVATTLTVSEVVDAVRAGFPVSCQALLQEEAHGDEDRLE